MEINNNYAPYRTNIERSRNYQTTSSELTGLKDRQRFNNSQISDSVLVEISNEGFKKLEIDKFKYPDAEWRKHLAEEQAAKEAAWEAADAVVHNSAHQIIPNIQTNDQLVKSLAGLDKNVVDAAYDIINEHLLKRDVDGLTEEQRQGLISLGMEKAKYLAQNYMAAGTANQFLGAMEKIAQYGMNGTVNEGGQVTFDIQQGPLVGAPDDNAVDYTALMKSRNPEKYEEYYRLMQEGINNNDSTTMGKAMKIFIDWSIDLHKNNPEVIAGAVKDYTDWKKSGEGTKVADTYKGSDYSGIANFLDSIRNQNFSNQLFGSDYLESCLQSFLKRLGISK
jgi:hypothetical protein